MNDVQEKGPRRTAWERWVWLRALAVGGGVALLLGWFTFYASPGIFQGFEAELYDMRVSLASNVNEAPDPDELGFIVITIDDYSLGEIGEFRQWPRDIHGQLARKLGEWGAAAIFFDLLFTREDRDPEIDRKLAEHFGSAGVVYNAISLIDRESFVYESAVQDFDWSVLENSPRSAFEVAALPGAEMLPDFAVTKVLDGPPLRLCRSSLALGMVNVVGDEDGVIRRQPLLFRYGDVLLPTVALRMFLDLLGVNRDELPDGGAGIYAETIRRIRSLTPGCQVEVLIPDFKGDEDALQVVVDAKPEILGHNLETVDRLHPDVRPGGRYWRSISFLGAVKKMDPGMLTKTGIILGMGEEPHEIRQAMEDLREASVDILTLGQYLRPSPMHIPVARWVSPAEFAEWKTIGEKEYGFRHVESGPLVRSSYHAKEQARELEPGGPGSIRDVLEADIPAPAELPIPQLVQIELKRPGSA